MDLENVGAFVKLYYSAFLAKLAGELLTLAPEDRSNPAALGRLTSSAYHDASSFLVNTTQTLTNAGANGARIKELMTDLSRIVTQNVAQQKHDAKFGLQKTKLNDTGSNMAALAIKNRGQGGAMFRSTDSAGRLWNALELVAFLVKDFVYQSHIDDLIAAAKEAGIKTVTVRNPNPESKFAGKTMSLAAATAQRATIFHPNSSSTFDGTVQP